MESVLDFLHSLKPEPKRGQDALEFVNSLEKIRDFREFMKDPEDVPSEPMRGTQDSIYGPGNPAIHP